MSSVIGIVGVLVLAWIGGWLEHRREKRLRRYFERPPE
jgi:hypothetical protein